MRNLSNTLRLLTASSTLLAIGMMAAPAAQASNYYNCNTANGCSKVDSTNSRSDYDATKYPIVMAHGFLGWNRLLNSLDYFNGVPQTLMKNGAEVFTTKTTTVNSIEVRGEQLLGQVRTIKALTGSDKVNLVGHSQGGLDSRYVAGVAPTAVASITTVASPHTGVGLADTISEWAGNTDSATSSKDFNLKGKILAKLVEVVGGGIGAASGVPLDQSQKQSAKAFLDSVSIKAFVQFNNNFPGPTPSRYCGQPPANNVMNGVGYYSFSGVGQITNGFDPSDYLLKLTGSLYDKSDLNDGLVTKCSSRIGTVIRDDYRMNHLDSINQLLGMTSWRETNPLSVYRQQINRLKQSGY